MHARKLQACLRGLLARATAADVVVQVLPDGRGARHDAAEQAAQRQRVRQLRQRLPRGLQRGQVGRLQAPQQARLLLLQQRMPAASVFLLELLSLVPLSRDLHLLHLQADAWGCAARRHGIS